MVIIPLMKTNPRVKEEEDVLHPDNEDHPRVKQEKKWSSFTP